MWDQRAKQYFVANGIAVIQLNPVEDDSWDAGPWYWPDGEDRPYLTALLGAMASNTLGIGRVDTAKLLLRGWSGGAAMVSWLFQTAAAGGLPAGVAIAGGIMLSGGSYTCYMDPFANETSTPVTPKTTCAACVPEGPAADCFGSPPDPRCSSCQGGPTYCTQCCPQNYTEEFYFGGTAHTWSQHPPTFLAQTSHTDAHADLCATVNYYDTLREHGVRTQLVRVAPQDERCFCIGTPGDAAAAGSPFAAHCDSTWHTCTSFFDTNCCVAHTLGFASMVEPMVQFAVDAVRPD